MDQIKKIYHNNLKKNIFPKKTNNGAQFSTH